MRSRTQPYEFHLSENMGRWVECLGETSALTTLGFVLVVGTGVGLFIYHNSCCRPQRSCSSLLSDHRLMESLLHSLSPGSTQLTISY